MAKPRKSLKLTVGQVTALNAQLNGVENHLAKIVDVWASLPQWQKELVLANSPVLTRIQALAGRLG